MNKRYGYSINRHPNLVWHHRHYEDLTIPSIQRRAITMDFANLQQTWGTITQRTTTIQVPRYFSRHMSLKDNSTTDIIHPRGRRQLSRDKRFPRYAWYCSSERVNFTRDATLENDIPTGNRITSPLSFYICSIFCIRTDLLRPESLLHTTPLRMLW